MKDTVPLNPPEPFTLIHAPTTSALRNGYRRRPESVKVPTVGAMLQAHAIQLNAVGTAFVVVVPSRCKADTVHVAAGSDVARILTVGQRYIGTAICNTCCSRMLKPLAVCEGKTQVPT